MVEINRTADYGKSLDALDQQMLGIDAARRATAMLSLHPSNKETPLHDLRGLAAEIGVGAIHIKDESTRLGLGSFKALGGGYAVVCLVLEEAGRKLNRAVSASELLDPSIRAIVNRVQVGCATDGNHGRSVAAGANLVGCKANIFVHSGVSDERVEAIARFGANVIRVPGSYDDAVAEAGRVCKDNGWITVSDTSWPGYEQIPRLVMQGYTVMVTEILKRLRQPPTHVFLQAGVGGFAAAVAANLALTLPSSARPKFVVVEPDRAACLFESNKAGQIVSVKPTQPTIMAMLECYEPSLIAWRILSRLADAFMTVREEDAVNAMNRLARPVGTDEVIVAGESGGAGLAGLLDVAASPDARAQLHLDGRSRILLFNTEGATAPQVYQELTGLNPAELLLV
jgi:diaminopropionate ammonia-lyase